VSAGGGAGGPGPGSDSPGGLLGPAEVRAIAAALDLRPTKQLGQNFLHDPNTVRRIVRTAGLRQDDVVLEVGPGLGSLTLGLLPAVARLVAVEVDPRLAAALPGTVASRLPAYAERLHVVTADALRLGRDPGAPLPAPPPSALVANLPYNVAVPVVLHLLASVPGLRRGLVMVQAEVAERLAAPPGSRVYGVPSVKVAWYAEVRRAGAVGRTVFWPEPRVDSGLVALDRRRPPEVAGVPDPVEARRRTFAVVDAAFAQRRKTLRAALAGWAGSPAAAEQALRAAGVDPSARGEDLSVTDYAAIAGASIASTS